MVDGCESKVVGGVEVISFPFVRGDLFDSSFVR